VSSQNRCIAGGSGCFRENAQVGRLALDLPVFPRQPQSSRSIVFDRQPVPRFLAFMQRIAASACGIEAIGKLPPVLGECRCRIGQLPLGESKTQQKVVVSRLVRYQRSHLAGPAPVEQEVAIGGDQVRVTWLESERGAKVRFGGGMVATAVGNLAGQGQGSFA